MDTALAEGKAYILPPRPEALISLGRLLKSETPDIAQVTGILKRDPSLYSTVLATVNKPLFCGGRTISSIHHAVMLLGLEKLHSLVQIAALKSSLSKAGRLERFWDSATEVAELTATLSRQLTDLPSEHAYSLGMLHDCGIPLMIEAFDGYRDLLQRMETDDCQTLRDREQTIFGYDHYRIGARIAHHWYMPDSVSEAIRLQPDFQPALAGRIDASEASKLLLCCLILAKNISRTYRRYWRIGSEPKPVELLKPVLNYIGLPDVDYLDLRDDLLANLEQIQ
ncbi:HDOD domain-containing protein [Marinobacterium arenosum]|uniref:HDOD domain-containing protein n=1 Tax=Marinobacterium arenosum TaxID=2862496 RepID=UPI001C973134|nr:HDOD domain-containing protein [Marinobacterium arenosum]MBY4677708.1 HDOD domain-containing protein [Marinobacterium arenosum]